ncbi:MAG: [FeFe] hydrogenase H-cluster maturation GTPase HydF [Lachnospiraceae bacterium]
MSLNHTPSGERIHIGIFGKRNAGKSSIMNAVTGQKMAIVSDVKGTTTDPVSKAMELLPLGPIVMIDTPGLDDEGVLGEQRVEKARQVLNKTDIALLVIDVTQEPDEFEESLLKQIREKQIPYLVLLNKSEQIRDDEKPELIQYLVEVHPWLPKENMLFVSAMTGENIAQCKERMARMIPEKTVEQPLIRDLLMPGDVVVLVVPIDSAAPKGRLILPQQQTIRDVLEAGAMAMVTRDAELEQTLSGLAKKPRLVVTDSQAFEQVSRIVPEDIPLTSFSILFARYKGELWTMYENVQQIDKLPEGDSILIAEGCTHHRQCDDIGTVKLPKWIQAHTGKKFDFHFVSGTEFPQDVTQYDMVVHCGGCMLNEKEMKHRIRVSEEQSIPIVNYGILIAYMNGILERAVAPLIPTKTV